MIDHYRVLRRIGKGGQGEVYLAHDPNLDIEVALKVLHADFRTEEFIDRFKVEARTAVRLTAPNIVRVYNFNPNYPYLAMEYCSGGDLDDLIRRRRPMKLSRTLEITRQICRALAQAHDHKPPILHRDLKPGNVLFNQNEAKVADFGLAKMLGANTGLTQTRGMMGTVGYASPEQLVDASKAGPRSDLWAVGIILYELLTFRRPFEKDGDDYVNVAIKVRMEPPAEPPFEIAAPVWAVIERALQKEPEDRHESAQEFLSDLEAAMATLGNLDELVWPPAETMGEADQLATRIADHLDQREIREAQKLATQMKESFPEDSLTRYWTKCVRELIASESDSASRSSMNTGDLQEARFLESRLNSINLLIDGHKLRDARRKVYELLAEDPDNTVIQGYISRIDEMEAGLTAALEQAHKDADAARGAGDPGQLYRIWNELNKRYPGLPDVIAELAVAQRELRTWETTEKRQSIERAVARLVEKQDWDGAIAAWDSHLRAFPEDNDAKSARQALAAERQTIVHAEKFRRAIAEVERLRATDGHAAAVAVMEKFLEEHPGHADATVRLNEVRGEIAAQQRATTIARATELAAKRVAENDLDGALEAWKSCLAEIPDCDEAQEQVGKLEQQIAEQHAQSLREAIERQSSMLSAALEGGRFLSLPEIRGKLAGMLESARPLGNERPARLEAARRDLAAFGEEAEATIDQRLAELRTEFKPKIDEALALLGEETGDGGAPLYESTQKMMAALATRKSLRAVDDPIAPLAEAGQELSAAIELVADQRDATLLGLRAAAEAAVSGAESALSNVPAAARSTLGEDLDQRLAALKSDLASSSTARLSSSATGGAVLAARAAQLSAEYSANAVAGLRESYEQALTPASQTSGDTLMQMMQRACDLLEGDEAVAGAAGQIAELTEAMNREISRAKSELATSAEKRKERWSRAEQSWKAAPSKLDADITATAEQLLKSGRAAVESGSAAEVETAAAQLDLLAGRAQLMATWDEQSSAVEALERAGADGSKSAGKLLGRYRAAAAAGDLKALKGLSSELNSADTSQAGPDSGPIDLPRLGGAARKLNERLHPVALEHYEKVAQAYERAEGSGSRREIAKLGAELLEAHGRLLQPLPITRQPLPLAAAASVVLVAAVAGGSMMMGGSEPSTVALVSAAGTAQIAEIKHNGSRLADAPGAMTIPEGGVRWELEPGRYEIKTEGGREMIFEVPGATTVVIPGATRDYSTELVRELGLNQLLSASDN